MRFLVPIDGSPNSERAVEHLTRLKDADSGDVHLLHVQPAAIAGDILSPDAVACIERVLEAEAVQATLRADDLLTGAGIEHVTHVGTGEAGDAIASYARAHGCDQIIMGMRGLGTMDGLALGSVATKVIHIVDIPVTLVK